MAKLLLVEDDNNLREIYEARLQAEGYQIVSAKDGEEALVVAKSEKPDLIISDVMMPKISGFEMLDILRNTDELKGVKVIMLTALGQSDDQQRADKLGADRYLVKSQVTLEDIVRTAHELLGDQAAADGAAPAAPEEAAPESPAEPETPAEPEPAAAEPAKTSEEAADAAASEEAAKPAAQEEADVEARIEDFVTGATTEATPPADPAQAAPAPAATPVSEPSSDSASAADASDDKLMADAVDELMASTGQQDEPADAGTPAKSTSIPISVAPDTDAAPEPAQPAAPEPPAAKAEPESEPAKPAAESEGSSKKVIKPLDSQPKKDINQLLAEEEAKEAQTVPGATIPAGSVIEEDKPSGAPMAAPSDAEEKSAPSGADPADPSSIAL